MSPTRRSWSDGRTLGGSPLGIALAMLSLLVAIAVAAALLLRVAPAFGEERPGEARIDLFDKSSRRTGAAIVDERSQRIDLYDQHSRRTGYGAINRYGDGKVDLYDTKGNRTGVVSPPSGRGRR